MKDRRGVVYAETLIAFLPVFTFFAATLQLADLSVAQLVVQHASTTAARAAAVVLPDDGAYYGDRDNQGLHQFGGARQGDIEQAADLILRANGRLDAAGANVGLDKSSYAERDDLTAAVSASYRCLLPIVCGGNLTLRSESKLVYQGAKFVYDPTTLGDVRPRRPPSGRPPEANDPNPDRPQDPGQRPPDDDTPRPPVADNDPPPRDGRPGQNDGRPRDPSDGRPRDPSDGRPRDPSNGRPPAVADNGRPPADGRPSDGRPNDPGNTTKPPAAADNGRPPANGRPGDGRPNDPSNAPRPPAVADNGRPPADGRPADGRPNDPSNAPKPPAVADNGRPPADGRPGDGQPNPPGDGKPPVVASNDPPPARPGAPADGRPATTPGTSDGRDPIASALKPSDVPGGVAKPDHDDSDGPIAMGPPGACQGGYCSVPGQCFAAGTLVHTAEGDRPIESIAVGDLIWSRDPSTGALALKPVTRRYITDDKPVLDVTITGAGHSERITTTPDHPFWVERVGWVHAGDLGEASLLWSPEGSLVAHAGAAWAERTKVYNLEVADYHTYFVGGLHAWVHNQCGPVSGRQWDDPNLTFDQFVNDYRALNPSTREGGSGLQNDELLERFEAGDRVYPPTGALRNLNSERPPSVLAVPRAGSPHNGRIRLHTLSKLDRRRISDALMNRRDAYREWQALRADPNASREETNLAGNRVNIASRQAGEVAADIAAHQIAENMGGQARQVYPPDGDDSSRPGDFDRVYEVRMPDGTTQYLVVEAKGGSAGLEAATVNGERVQQGSRPYYEHILANMANNSNGAMRTAGQLLAGADPASVHYVGVTLPFGNVNGNDTTPRPVQITEFDIRPPGGGGAPASSSANSP